MEKLKFVLLKGRHLNKLGKHMGKQAIFLDGSAPKAVYFYILNFGVIKAASFFISLVKKQHQQSLFHNNIMRRLIRMPFLFRVPLIESIYRITKNIHNGFLIIYFDHFLKKHDPDCVLIWNGSMMPDSVLCFVAKKRNIKILYFEQGYFPGTLQVDCLGINGYNSVVRAPEFYLNLPYSNIPLPQTLNYRKPKISTGTNTVINEQYIFVPFQVPSDMQILNLSPWVKSMFDFYEIIYQLAQHFPKEQFVIKEHPSFNLSIRDKVKKHQNIYFDNMGSTKVLIEKSKFVITVNSTVGIESILLGKKVISLGIACYNIAGLVLNCQNIQSVIDCIKNIDAWQFDETLRNSFLKYINQYYLLKGNINNINDQLVNEIIFKATGNDLHSIFRKSWEEMQCS